MYYLVPNGSYFVLLHCSKRIRRPTCLTDMLFRKSNLVKRNTFVLRYGATKRILHEAQPLIQSYSSVNIHIRIQIQIQGSMLLVHHHTNQACVLMQFEEFDQSASALYRYLNKGNSAYLGLTLPHLFDQWKISLLVLDSLPPLWPMKNHLTLLGLSVTFLTNESSAYLGWTSPPLWAMKAQLTWVGLPPPPFDQRKISLFGLDSLPPLWPMKITYIGWTVPHLFDQWKISLLWLDSRPPQQSRKIPCGLSARIQVQLLQLQQLTSQSPC